MKVFKLPDLGEGLPDAIIREWYTKEGESLKQDQPMVAMETAKALVDVPAPYSGIVEKLFGAVGDTIDTGTPLIGFEGEGAVDEKTDAGTVVGSIEESGTSLESTNIAVGTANIKSNTIKATPAVRMLAKQLGVDLNTLNLQGKPITAEIVKQAALRDQPQQASYPQLSGNLTKLDGVRRAMAVSMTQSHQHIVPASLMGEADLFAWNDKQDITLRIIRAMQGALLAEPLLNAYYDGNQLAYQLNEEINLGIAVDTKHGLFVPVLKNIAQKDDPTLRHEINRFKKHAQDRSFPKEDLQAATIIMSNVGAIAGSYAAPVIIPPMVAIVAFGRTKPTVMLNPKGELEAHTLLPISITFDHRPVTGGDAARFLKVLIEQLEQSSVL